MNKKLPDNFELNRYGVHCRLVNEGDAEFITALRADSKLGRFIHAGAADIQKQVEWIREYKIREAVGEDFYFIFLSSKDNTPLGVNRAYHITEDSFTTGSWIFSKDAPVGVSLVSEIIMKEILFDLYPNHKQLFDIRKGNTNVLRYAMSFKPTKIGEDEENLYFENNRENAEKYKRIYLRLVKNN